MLKFSVDSLDTVEEAFRPLYQEREGKFYLGVEGAVSADKHAEFRTNNVNLLKERDALIARFKDVDPDKYRELSATETKIREKQLIEAGQVETLISERVATMRADQEKQIKAIAGERDSMKGRLEGLVIDSALRDAAIKSGVAATAVDDVLFRGRAAFKLVDGKAVAMDGDKPLYGKDSEPLSVGEWVGGLKDAAPHLFPASNGGGAKPNAGNNGGGAAGKTITRAAFAALDPSAQMAAIKESKIVD